MHWGYYSCAPVLVRARLPVLMDTTVVEVRFQTKHSGWETDDIMIVGERSDGISRKLAIQVTRNLTISAKNEKCRGTFIGMWDDFCADGRFDRSRDQLAVVTLNGTTAVLRDFGSLLLCARATHDAEDFRRRLTLEGYISKRAREQDGAVETILDEHVGEPLEAELYWRFLRAINVLSLDLNTPTAQSKASLLSLLSHYSVDTASPEAGAEATWGKLLECAGEGKAIARTYVREQLPEELRQRYSSVTTGDSQALTALAEHGKTVLAGTCQRH